MQVDKRRWIRDALDGSVKSEVLLYDAKHGSSGGGKQWLGNDKGCLVNLYAAACSNEQTRIETARRDDVRPAFE